MIFKILTTVILALPTAALAEDTQHDELERRGYCADYDYDQRGCDAQFDCSFDLRSGLCEERGGGGGGGGGGTRGCSSYDFDPATCNSQRDCSYDHRARRCYDHNPGPGPGPGGRDCWYYDDQPRLCDQTPGCSYDRHTRSCQDDFGPGPGPGPRTRTQTIHCASGSHRYNRCAIQGDLISAYLVQQVSAARCIEGQTWGQDHDGIWVDRGCRGNFQVTYRPYH